MTNTKLLKEKIAEVGIKKGVMAEKLGLSRPGFTKKLNGQTDFKSEEILKMCEMLNITSLTERERIFFAKTVD